ncbi:Bacterial regulatory protein, gntR family [compost metagenome]
MIHAGQRLLEADISRVLGVSRAPVREALRILERERLVEFRARRGAIVTAPNEHDLRCIYVVREALYAILLRELMENRPEDLEALLAQKLPQVARAAAESADAYASESFLANLAMTDLSSNRLTTDLLNSISLRTLRYVRLGLAANPDMVEDLLDTWWALHHAISKRDIDAVLQTAQRRIEDSRDAAVRTLLQPVPGQQRRLRQVRPVAVR